MNILNVLIALLQLNFLFVSYTVERAYCRGPLDDNDTTPLVQAAIDFCHLYNPLFAERPEWAIKATCIHAHCFWVLYTIIFFTAVSDLWHNRKLQIGIVLGIGAKLNAVLFYHYMEFTSHNPPPNLLAYFGAEGAYLVSIGLVLYQIFSTPASDTRANTKKKKSP